MDSNELGYRTIQMALTKQIGARKLPMRFLGLSFPKSSRPNMLVHFLEITSVQSFGTPLPSLIPAKIQDFSELIG